MGAGPVKSAFRSLFGMLDGIIYGFISTVYDLLNEIAHFRVFDNEALQEFATRIYAILGVVMLFKLSFSFINYMINPDAFTDKQKGVQNIVINIVVMFCMLIMSPWAFTQLWNIQGAIIEENVISRFIFGTVDSAEANEKYHPDCAPEHVISNSEDEAGEFIAKMVLRGFYQPYNTKNIKDSDYYDDTLNSLCGAASNAGISSMLADSIYNQTTKNSEKKGSYIMEYKFGASTVAGVIVLMLLINFCIDVGTRMVKLSFLQLIAPIPIISYIDPASGKNGIFMKWLKEVGKTWVSIFIKLLSIFFAVAIIQHVGVLVPVGIGERTASIWVQIFVILGALIFAKQLPDLIQNITGIKMEGGFNLNPFKKIENEALFGKQIANTARGTLMAGANAAVSGVGQMASNSYNFSKTRRNLKKAIAKETDADKKAKLQRQLKQMHFGRSTVTSLGGLVGGATRGVRSGFTSGRKGDYHVFKNAKEDITQGNQKRDNLSNIHKYNSEVNYRAKQEKKDYLSEADAIKRRDDLTEEQKKAMLKDRKKEYKEQKKEFKEQHYGFFERTVGESLDQWAGVKNEYGGVGYYDKKISDIERKISDNRDKEQAKRTAIASYCTNNNINQDMVENYHEKHLETRGKVEQKYEIKRKEMYKEAYEEKTNAEFQTRYQEKENSAFQTEYQAVVQEEYQRLMEENGGAPLTQEQYQQISEYASTKAKEKVKSKAVQKEITANIEKEIKEEVEEKIYTEAEQEVLAEFNKDMEEEYGLSIDEIKEQYEKVRIDLENITKINKEHKELKKQKSEFADLISARETAEKK